MFANRLAAAAVFAGALASSSPRGAIALAPCEDVGKMQLENTTITVAEPVAAGSFKLPPGVALDVAVPFCRVALTMKPSADSTIDSEVWMPLTGWNGKFLGVGNGGFAGSISYAQMATAVARGYATASTDTGHKTGPGIDASWALNHPEKIKDFGYRAIHETAVAGKKVTSTFYSTAPKRAYFSSCSNGGRQALMEAQRFPEDYDGIIAGAPANYWTRLLSMAIVNSQATLADAASYFPASKLAAISAAALAACDSNDGVKDGVIENPAACRFDPAVLLCTGSENDSCVTAPQLTALRKIYDVTRTSAGETIMPGYSPGGEAETGGWAFWITGPAAAKSAMYGFGTQFFSYMVFGNPAWDFRTFNLDRDRKAAADKVGRDLDAESADLREFRARGGKLILYHGWSDAAIPAQHTIDYFNSIAATMGSSNAASFVRLYMIPGMQHCGGGSGATAFGQQIGGTTADPAHNITATLEQWVEQDAAPGPVIASKTSGGNVVGTRPICPYPQTAHYKGAGGTDTAESFVCQ